MVWFLPGDSAAHGSSCDDVAVKIIGRVTFTTHRGEPAEAILGADGLWNCPQLPVLNRVLNILHAPKRGDEDSPTFGEVELRRVAAWIKGRVVL